MLHYVREASLNIYVHLAGLTLDAVYGKTPKKAVEEGKASKE